MILLQGAMGFGFVILVLSVLIVLITALFIVPLLMRLFWRITDKEENIKNKLPYYKDPPVFIVSILLSALLALAGLYLLFIWFEKAHSGSQYYF